MRVALLTNLLPPYRVALMDRLAADLDDLLVYIDARTEDNRHWEDLPIPPYVRLNRGLRLRHRVQRPGGAEAHTTYFPLSLVSSLIWGRPDTVVTTELGLRSLIATLYTIAFRRRLIFWLALTQATEKDYGSLRRRIRRSVLSRADGILVHSSSAERYLREDLGITGQILIYPQVSELSPKARMVEIDQPRETRRRLTVLYIGQLIPRKNLVPALRYLFAHVPSDLRLDVEIVGSGGEEMSLRRLSEAAPDHIRVRFHGRREPESLPEYLSSADAFLFPSLHDDWGLVVNEALQFGLPIIGSTGAGAVQELIRDGVEGYCFPPGDHPGMLRGLLRLAALPEPERAAMREACRHRSTSATTEGLANALLALIKPTAGRGHADGRRHLSL